MESALVSPIHEALGQTPGESQFNGSQNSVPEFFRFLSEAHSGTLKHFAYSLNHVFNVIIYKETANALQPSASISDH